MKPSHFLLFALVWILPAQASAHVYIESPEEDAQLQKGETVQIVWSIAVNHGPPDTYDLMFSRDGGIQYQMIAEELPSSTNSLVWTAPDADIPNGVLSIVQHGSNGYEFMHEVQLQIGEAAPPGDMGHDDAGVPDAGSSDVGVHDVGRLLDRPDAQMAVDDDVGGIPATGEEVLELLDRRCAVSGCHHADAAQADLDLSSEAFGENLVEVPATTSGRLRISLEDPESSELIDRLRGESGLRMPPPPEERFSEERIDALLMWIAAGAPAQGTFESGRPIEGTPGDDPGHDERGCATTTSDGSSTVWGLLFMLAALLMRRR